MKKYIFICALIVVGSYYYYTQRFVSGAEYRIAILMPVTHAALDEIKTAFQETLQNKICCSYDVYNAHGDRVLLHTLAEKIVHGRYDLALAIATQPSLIMKEVSLARSSTMPIVCTAVDDPVKNGLIYSLESSHNRITTVIEQNNKSRFSAQLDCVKKIIPSLKKLILIYTPQGILDRQKDTLQQCCHEKNIDLSLLPIYASHELTYKVSVLVPGHDCAIILKDNAIVSCIESLVGLCTRMGIPLCTSDLNSFAAGAACSYGVYEAEFGKEAAYKAYAIIHDKKKPGDIPSTVVGGYSFVVNRAVLDALKIPYNEEYFKNSNYDQVTYD